MPYTANAISWFEKTANMTMHSIKFFIYTHTEQTHTMPFVVFFMLSPYIIWSQTTAIIITSIIFGIEMVYLIAQIWPIKAPSGIKRSN